MCRQRPERPTIPLHYRGDQFGDDNFRILWKQVERYAQRETHSQTANKNAWLLAFPRPLAGERGQCVFRAVHAARHEDRAINKYDVLIIATNQLDGSTVWGNRLAEQLERLHERDVTGEKSLSTNGSLTIAPILSFRVKKMLMLVFALTIRGRGSGFRAQ